MAGTAMLRPIGLPASPLAVPFEPEQMQPMTDLADLAPSSKLVAN